MFALLLSVHPQVSAAAQPIAVVPVAGERVSLEEVPLYERLDTAMRTAAGGVPGIALQPVEETKRHMGAVRETGIDCDMGDAGCLAKLAVLAGVDRLLVPHAKREGDVFHVRLLVVDAAGRSADVRGDVPVVADDAGSDAVRRAARGLVDDALTLRLLPHATRFLPDDGRDPTKTSSNTGAGLGKLAPPPPPPPPPPAPQPMLGISLLAVGGTVALAGVGGALVMNEQLAVIEDYTQRAPKQTFGQICVIAAVTGAATAGVGGLLFAVGM